MSGWGNPIDPDKDCKITRKKGALIIEMPGTVHDYYPLRKRVNAPRLLRDFEGDFEIQVRVKIDCRPSAQSTVKDQLSYVSAGFLIIPPDNFFTNCIRLEYKTAGKGYGADGCLDAMVQNFEGGRRDDRVGYKPPEWPFKGKPDYVYLRLERSGEVLSYRISSDGKSWVKTYGVGGIAALPSKLKVGFAACSTSADPSKVQFDQLKIIHKNRVPWGFVSHWGDPVNPDKDCKIQRDTDVLSIDMPGTYHDYDPVRKRFNAPRLVCDTEGNFDMEVRVKIDSRPSAQSTVKGQPAFVSAGFLLIYPEKEYPVCDRLEYAVSQQGRRPDAYAVAPKLAQPRGEEPPLRGKEADKFGMMKTWIGTPQRKGNTVEWDQGRPQPFNNILWERGWRDWPLPEKAQYAYLRLDHQVGWASFYISPDGEKWTRLEYLPHVTAKCRVALAAYTTSPNPSKVRFDQLKVARAKKQE